jgi:hypothetical protein
MKYSTFYKLYYAHRIKKSKLILKIYILIILPFRYLINLIFFPRKKNIELIAKKNPDLFKKNLNFLFEFFNSDKGEFFCDQYVQPLKKNSKKIHAHGYAKIYEKFFLNKKNNNLNILELGSFHGNAAASLFFYFKNAQIYSGDIFPDLFRYKSKRIKNFFINTSKEISIKKMILDNNLDFDIVIEDAGHFLKDQIISLFMIFKKVRSGGLFIIEELDFPDTRTDMNINEEFPTLKKILNLIIENKDFKSQYILDEDKKYFLKNFDSIEIFQGKKNQIAVVKKK